MKLLYGVGIYDLRNDPSHATSWYEDGKRKLCPYYQRWFSIIQRLHSKRHQQRRPTYHGCVICEEWKTFSNFMAWMKTQRWEGKEIDKDIIVPGNKLYSPETCVFVSRNLNSLLLGSLNNTQRGELPIGVTYCKKQKIFKSYLKLMGKTTYVGIYDNPDQAHEAYKKAKIKHILEVAENLTEDDTSDIERTRQGLIRHVEEGLIFK